MGVFSISIAMKLKQILRTAYLTSHWTLKVPHKLHLSFKCLAVEKTHMATASAIISATHFVNMQFIKKKFLGQRRHIAYSPNLQSRPHLQARYLFKKNLKCASSFYILAILFDWNTGKRILNLSTRAAVDKKLPILQAKHWRQMHYEQQHQSQPYQKYLQQQQQHGSKSSGDNKINHLQKIITLATTVTGKIPATAKTTSGAALVTAGKL